ncbi:hypothetical protein CLAIMM_04109 [Cladophialophora immunda]|nr:hypothetical protein CLAIMM_04109 [Cladophialophora immunda]
MAMDDLTPPPRYHRAPFGHFPGKVALETLSCFAELLLGPFSPTIAPLAWWLRTGRNLDSDSKRCISPFSRPDDRKNKPAAHAAPTDVFLFW